ncbi:MAG: hypothetical protein ABIG85_03915 [Chloroflexota bacterium]
MDQERMGTAPADAPDDSAVDAPDDSAVDAPDDEPIEVTGGVEAAGRRLISEDWAATILGLVLLALVLGGVIGKGMVP